MQRGGLAGVPQGGGTRKHGENGGFITRNPSPAHLFLSAGEASGDHYGAELIAALRPHLPDATFTGLGGREMEAAGLQRIVRAEDVAHMGITEVLRHMPRVFREYRKLVAALKRAKPDLAILIDFPDVNFRLAKHCKLLGIPVVWFVSPQLWAWKRRRLRWVQQRVTRMLVIFPFEEPFYRARGVAAEFVGHPLVNLPLPAILHEEYALQHNLDPAKPWIALLPGSREREVALNLPPMIAAAEILNREGGYQFILPVATTLKRQSIRKILADLEKTGRAPFPIRFVSDAREALHYARASVVASGTATLQAALIGNPFVVVYKVSRLTFALAKRLVRYPEEISASLDGAGNLPIAMPNLIAGRRIVPELLNPQFTAGILADTLKPLLEDSPQRREMIADLAEVRNRLTLTDSATAIDRVRDSILALLRSPHPHRPS